MFYQNNIYIYILIERHYAYHAQRFVIHDIFDGPKIHNET